ncbi:MAG: tetratricopeptide repeat protein [Kiritimatiellaeota bacterium]|nr:tetratricopeptide repeat protein [Kiritimatiellota bacterium]
MCLRSHRAPTSRESRALLAAVLLAVVVRALYLFQLARLPDAAVAVGPDVREYHTWALDILGGALLWSRVHIHAPLYAYFLAGLYWLTDQNILIVRAVQLGLNVAALILTVLALRVSGQRRGALVLAWLWAVYLPMVFYAGELVSEGLLVFWISLALLLFASAARHAADPACRGRNRRLFFLAGLALGLAAVTHPLSLGFGLLCPALAARRVGRVRGRRAGASAAGAITLGLLLPVLAVATRNYAVSDEIIPIQARAGLNFFIGNNPAATGTCYVRPGRQYRQLLEAPLRAGIKSEQQSTRFFLDQAWGFIREHPLEWLGLLGRKFLLTWNARELVSGADLPQLRPQPPLMSSTLLRFGPVAPFAFLGLVFVRRRRALTPFVALVASYTLVLTLLVVSGRYRVGMLPGVLALAAAGLEWLRRAVQRRDGRRLAAGALVLAVGLATAYLPRPPPLPSASAEVALARAEAAYRTGALATAEKAARDALRTAPGQANALMLLGIIAADRGNHQEAIRYYRQALQAAPDDPEASVNLAVSLSILGKKTEAADLLKQTLLRRPDSAQAWYNFGVIQQERGKPTEAADAYRHALRIRPGLPSPHLNLAVILQQQGKLDEALRHYRAAVRVAPRKVNAMNALAVFLAGRGDVRGAVRWFEKSLKLNPNQIHIWLMYSDFLLFSNRKADAAKALERACRANPDARLLRQTPLQRPKPPSSQGPSAASSGAAAEKR